MRKASLASATAGALAAIAAFGASAQQPANGHMYWRHAHMMGDAGWMADGGWLGMIFGSLLMLVTFTALIAAVVFLARWAGGPVQGPPSAPSARPLDILKERFARGEIDKEEFEDRRRVLGD